MNPPELTPAEIIDKRRRQIEKAKAAHLSRQLQTRLQYARLKVDHGWQKQTLNEVENLYFHHYRARTSPRGSRKPEKKSVSPSKRSPAAHAAATSSVPDATSIPMVSTHRTDQQQVPRLADAPQVSTDITAADVDESPAMEVDPLPDSDAPNSSVAEQSTSSVQVTQPTPHDPTSHSINLPFPQPLATGSPSKPPQPSLKPSPTPHTRNPSAHALTSQPQLPAPAVAVTSPPSQDIPLTGKPTPPPLASFSTRSRGPSHGIRPSHSAPSSLLPGSSNAALTYDSFWSSHSTSTNYRSSLTNTASYPNLNKGDASLALPTLGTSYAFSMSAPSAPFQPLPLQKQPILARKPPVPAPLRQSFSGSMGH